MKERDVRVIMRKRFLILLICLFLLTGCNVKVNLTVDENKKVKENISISVLNIDVPYYGYDSSDEFLDHYKNEYSNIPGYKDFDIKTKSTNSNSIFKAKREYKSLEDYIKSYSFLNIYNYAYIDNTGNYLTFRTSKNLYLEMLQGEQLGHVGTERTYEISVKFYNEVIESNADKVDKSNNVYTWYIDKTTDLNDSDIYFKLGPKVKYFVKFKDYIMENIISIIIIAIIILLILFSGLYIVYKSKKNNEI